MSPASTATTRRSQRTADELPEIVLDAASEFVSADATEQAEGDGTGAPPSPWLSAHYPGLDTLFDYLPDAKVLIEDREVEQRAAPWFEQIREAHEGARLLPAAAEVGGAAPVPERLFLSQAEWEAVRRRAEPLARRGRGAGDAVRDRAQSGERLSRLYRRTARAAGRRIVLAAAEERDLKLAGPARRERSRGTPASGLGLGAGSLGAAPGAVLLLRADFDAGFVRPAGQGRGDRRLRPARQPRRPQSADGAARGALEAGSESALRIGDAVIHIEHGIGRLRGIESVAATGIAEQEALRIEYAGGAVLMVPVGEIEQVWRYGAESEAVSLDRLDGEGWKKRREQVEHDIAETARGLLRLTREREAREAPKLEPAVPPLRALRRRVSRSCRPSIRRARSRRSSPISKSGHPMDRLVCGDVGFGKTEVALRAAAAAVFGGNQVALVAPTTVLVRQHLNTFRRRFARSASKIAGLSRLVHAGRGARGQSRGWQTGRSIS